MFAIGSNRVSESKGRIGPIYALEDTYGSRVRSCPLARCLALVDIGLISGIHCGLYGSSALSHGHVLKVRHNYVSSEFWPRVGE